MRTEHCWRDVGGRPLGGGFLGIVIGARRMGHGGGEFCCGQRTLGRRTDGELRLVRHWIGHPCASVARPSSQSPAISHGRNRLTVARLDAYL